MHDKEFVVCLIVDDGQSTAMCQNRNVSRSDLVSMILDDDVLVHCILEESKYRGGDIVYYPEGDLIDSDMFMQLYGKDLRVK